MGGERVVVGVGLFTLAVCFGLLGFVDSLEAGELFISAVTLRLIQGFCQGAIHTTCQAEAENTSLFETMRALGLLIGPVIGILLNATFNL